MPWYDVNGQLHLTPLDAEAVAANARISRRQSTPHRRAQNRKISSVVYEGIHLSGIPVVLAATLYFALKGEKCKDAITNKFLRQFGSSGKQSPAATPKSAAKIEGWILTDKKHTFFKKGKYTLKRWREKYSSHPAFACFEKWAKEQGL